MSKGSNQDNNIGANQGGSSSVNEPGGNIGKFSEWRRRPLFLISLAVVGMAIAAGAGAALWSTRVAPAEDSTGTSDAVVKEDTLEMPLASDAAQIMSEMSLEEKIGQMMMVGFPGSGPDAAITEAIQKRHVGGIVLFSRNIVSREQVAGMNTALQKLAADSGHPVKLMIAVDQEGGKTRRFTDVGPYYSEPMIGEMHDAAPDAAQQQAASAARDLKRMGINTNLAPVVDVSAGWGTIMDVRAFDTDPGFVAELSARAVKGYNNATTISSPKHFPGHGSADGDSEDTLPVVDSDLETLHGTDLPPFAAVIEEGAPMIMVGHLSVPALDPTGTPSSLSRPIITGLLREGLGFQGVVITDDLEMGAVTESRGVGDAAVAAVAAGADIVMVAHTGEAQQQVFDALVAAVGSGRLAEADIDKSVVRIIEMKKKYRLEQ